MAASQNIPLLIVENNAFKGWISKPKGISVVGARAFGPIHYTHFENKQKKDLNQDGKVEFLAVLSDCANFLDEKTSLICHSERLEIRLIGPPKPP